MKRSNTILGFINWGTVYKTYEQSFHPSQAKLWAFHCKKGIGQLEGLQGKAVKMIRDLESLSYKERMSDLKSFIWNTKDLEGGYWHLITIFLPCSTSLKSEFALCVPYGGCGTKFSRQIIVNKIWTGFRTSEYCDVIDYQTGHQVCSMGNIQVCQTPVC